jgi:hypothetical protein
VFRNVNVSLELSAKGVEIVETVLRNRVILMRLQVKGLCGSGSYSTIYQANFLKTSRSLKKGWKFLPHDFVDLN